MQDFCTIAKWSYDKKNFSYCYYVVHSRDDQEVGMAHKAKSPENQPQLSQMMMGQYWLGKT